ncbi:MAG: DNA ligase D [Gemmataceae bacterium]
MGLREYKAKRHFQRTPEPPAKIAAKGGKSFVVQKHRARNLHYDFRLELDGVLKSWAVPKGPSLDPAVKRLAVQVEDHPVDYGSFEGVIPEGEYGGGTVMLWDQGTWEPVGDPDEGYRTGRFKFILHGEKLRGAWMLVRTNRETQYVEKRQWLLFKERDYEARPASEGDILDEMPLSVQSGRSLEGIAADRDRVWKSRPVSHGKSKRPLAPPKVPPGSKGKSILAKVAGKKKAPIPVRVDVQLASLAKKAPEGDLWFHEIKFDGYRMICKIDKGRVSLVSRNHKDWTERLPSLVAAARKLRVRRAILDGEIVAMRADGTTNFQDLQNAFRDRGAGLLNYFVFDLLYLDGYDLTKLPLEQRKRILTEILGGHGVPASIHLSEHIQGNGPAFLQQASKMHLEGIVSKRRDSPYRRGRTLNWLKIKCVKKAEFVIGGYTEPTGSRTGFGALLVGYHNHAGDLVYAGKVGTGFDDRTLRSLFERLVKLKHDKSPFEDFKSAGRAVHWVKPQLVAQVAYGDWTRDGHLRHPSFQGLSEGASAAEVTRDTPASPSSVDHTGNKDGRKDRATSDYDPRSQKFGGVRLTSPDKVLYPESGITKLELANYYKMVAAWMLPHVANRPLVLVRCPEGHQNQCFYQKHPPAGTPDTFRRIKVREKSKDEEYLVVDDEAGLVSIAQIAGLEVHVWGSQADTLEEPDRLIFDLDPDPAVPWKRVVDSAQQVRQFLEELGLQGFVKTTGGKGLHLVVPIERRHDWDEAKAFCKRVADLIVLADAKNYTSNMTKAARVGKIYIDYLRNARGSTAIAAYSTRARSGAPVSVPLSWKELSDRVFADHYTVRNLGRRLASLKHDPWEGIGSLRQNLVNPAKKMAELIHRLGPHLLTRRGQ